MQVDDINPHCLRVEDVEVAGTVEADAGNVAEGVWPSVDNMHTLAIDWEMNPDFDWNVEKNQRLVEQRGISFERVVSAIEQDGLVDILEHPNQERYAGQMIYVVDVEQYLYLVPFVTSADGTRFLKMIIPSRKATRHYRKRRIIVSDQRLNPEEREILEKFERDELKPASGADREMQIASRAARNTFKKTRRVNLRVTELDFSRAHARAREEGIPYQTLLSSVIHKFLAGRLVEKG